MPSTHRSWFLSPETLPLPLPPTSSVGVVLGVNMRENPISFKRFIFNQAAILRLTMASPSGAGYAIMGCARAGRLPPCDINVNICHCLVPKADVLHEPRFRYTFGQMILSAPIDQKNTQADHRGGDHDLHRDHLAIYKMSQKNRKDRC